MYINFSVLCATPACLLVVWLVAPKAMKHAQNRAHSRSHVRTQLFTVQINCCFVVEAVVFVRCIYRKRAGGTLSIPIPSRMCVVIDFQYTTEHKFHSRNVHERIFDNGVGVEYMHDVRVNSMSKQRYFFLISFAWFVLCKCAYTCSKCLGQR